MDTLTLVVALVIHAVEILSYGLLDETLGYPRSPLYWEKQKVTVDKKAKMKVEIFLGMNMIKVAKGNSTMQKGFSFKQHKR